MQIIIKNTNIKKISIKEIIIKKESIKRVREKMVNCSLLHKPRPLPEMLAKN